MLPLVNIFDDQHVVLNMESASVKFLAAYISNANVDVITASRVGDSSDQLRLAVEKDELNPSLNIVECYSAHGATMAHVLLRQVNRCQRIGEAGSDQMNELHFFLVGMCE